MAKIRIFTDFDGTITVQDSLVWLLNHYVGSSWLEIEERVEDGSLSEEQGLREEIALIDAPWDEVRELALTQVPIDPSFGEFAALCRDRAWELCILSGGLEPLIRALLAREGLADLPLRANDLTFAADGRWQVIPADSPRINALCNHCKSHWLVTAKSKGERIVYIGDGTTDRCPGAHADLLFAKAGLAAWCEAEGIAHHSFENFAEIKTWLESDAGLAWLNANPDEVE